MKKLGLIMIIIAIFIMAFYFVFLQVTKQKAVVNINNYIESTSIIEKNEIIENTTDSNNVVKSKEKSTKHLNYTAVLEIPKINLKEGIVDVTNGFKSIKYAISADSNGNYPNINGNFILYAHSGNSSIAFFKNLYKLNLNDNIYVYFNGIKYHYIVFNKYDIEKTGKAKVTNSNKEKYITLITCNQQRKGYQIIIEGKLIDESNY